MLLCNYTMECNSNSVVLYLKAYYISYRNEEPVSKRLYCINAWRLYWTDFCSWNRLAKPNGSTHISKIWVLIKTHLQKLGYIIKLVMFLRYTYAKTSNNHKLLSHKTPPPPLLHHIFLENRQNSNSHLFCKVGEIQLWLIKTK